jgi:hypothetical protein
MVFSLRDIFASPEEKMAKLKVRGEAWAKENTLLMPVDEANDLIAVCRSTHDEHTPLHEITQVKASDDEFQYHIRRFSVPVDNDAEGEQVPVVEFKPFWGDIDPKLYAKLDAQITRNYEDRCYGSGSGPKPE